MLTLFNKIHKKSEKNSVDHENVIEDIQENIEHVDETSLKKSIAAKLQGYQPVERPANFVGPKYYQ